MVNALWITLIGMGLVFISIIMLWGLMALLVRLAAERGEPEPVEAEPAAEMAASEEVGAGLERKRRAAAAAVAVALARRKPARAAQAASSLSTWQAVQRANQVSQRVSSSRKKVVR
jgi:Na+-transporting methylmalonyl-CoA/oxaloacetate decarboxylase gamma subunit